MRHQRGPRHSHASLTICLLPSRTGTTSRSRPFKLHVVGCRIWRVGPFGAQRSRSIESAKVRHQLWRQRRCWSNFLGRRLLGWAVTRLRRVPSRWNGAWSPGPRPLHHGPAGRRNCSVNRRCLLRYASDTKASRPGEVLAPCHGMVSARARRPTGRKRGPRRPRSTNTQNPHAPKTRAIRTHNLFRRKGARSSRRGSRP